MPLSLALLLIVAQFLISVHCFSLESSANRRSGWCVLSEADFREWRGGMLGLESPSGWEEASAAAGNGGGPKRALCSCQLGLQTPALLANRFDSRRWNKLAAFVHFSSLPFVSACDFNLQAHFIYRRPLKLKVGLVFVSTNISEVYSGTFHDDKLSN